LNKTLLTSPVYQTKMKQRRQSKIKGMNAGQPIPDKLLPVYPLAQVARFVGCNQGTLRAWMRGRTYVSGGEKRRAKPMFEHSSHPRAALTFLDLVEAHMLHLVRRGYGIPMRNFRTAVEYLRRVGGDAHFLAHKDFVHDKKHLYLKADKMLISLSERGQHVNTVVIHDGLKQLMYGEDGYADKFFPVIGGKQQKVVMINPVIGYGQPTIMRLGVSTAAIAARFEAGERMADLASDYGATSEEVEEALRYNRVLCA
jgi:uncharacterized protein (DUF433 family)